MINNNLFENPKKFKLKLSNSSYNTKIKTLSSTTIIINNPNNNKSLLFFLINFKKLNTDNIKKKYITNN